MPNKDSQARTDYQRLAAPVLETDSWRKGLSKTQVLERTIVANLLALLAHNGWTPSYVMDGEEDVPAATAQAAMNAIFAVDLSHLYMTKDGSRHGIALVGGNGEDIIADYSFYLDDNDGFSAVMDAFNPEEFAA